MRKPLFPPGFIPILLRTIATFSGATIFTHALGINWRTALLAAILFVYAIAAALFVVCIARGVPFPSDRHSASRPSPLWATAFLNMAVGSLGITLMSMIAG